MRVKNLRVVSDIINGEDKLILVKKINNFEDLILRRNSSEYKCVFTGTIYYFDRKKAIPLSLFLPIEDMKKTISKKKLKKFYVENADMILEKSKVKTKKIGFTD